MSGLNGNGDDGGMIHKTAWDAARPAVEVRFRCEVVSTTRQGVVEQLAEILQVEGYFVTKERTWEKTTAFRKRLNLSHEALHRILKNPVCPPIDLDLAGPKGKGRITAVASNPVFEAFCAADRGKKPERSKWKRRSRAKPAHQLQRARMHGPKRNYATT